LHVERSNLWITAGDRDAPAVGCNSQIPRVHISCKRAGCAVVAIDPSQFAQPRLWRAENDRIARDACGKLVERALSNRCAE
jgi:hypothetical protein